MTRKVKKVSIEEMIATIRWFRAIDDYRNWNDKSKLIHLTETEDFVPEPVRVMLRRMAFGEVTRRKGQPPKVRFTDSQIVQLVLKAKLQAGCGFDNKHGDEGNESFCFVAENLGVTPGYIRRRFYSVEQSERAKIEDWLTDLLRQHGQLAEGRQ